MASGDTPGRGWIPPQGEPPGWGTANAGPPAGWLDDPTGRFERRYWSGNHWTPRVRVGEAEAIDREGVSSDAPARTADSVGSGGWFPDPTGRFEQRLLVGQSWTRQVRFGDAAAVDVLSVPNDVRLPKGVQRPGEAGTSTSPPGWWPDPDDAATERYWDGFQWTAARRPLGSGEHGQRLTSIVPRRVMVSGVLIVTVMIGLLGALFLWLMGVIG